MLRLYLIFTDTKAAVLAMRGPEDLPSHFWGGDYELHEIGTANWDTAPGMILAGLRPGTELTTVRPIGKKIDRLGSAHQGTSVPSQ